MRLVSRMKRFGVGWLGLAVVLLTISTTGCHKKEKKVGHAEPGQKTFASPAEAGKALDAAAKSDNQQQVLEVLGSSLKDLIYGADAAQDKTEMANFAAAYDRMNRWRKLEGGSEILLVGVTNTAFPVPLAQDANGQWFFDSAAGALELQVRRIGRNELAVIDIMASLADAQNEYFNQAHNGTKQYSRKMISTPGQQDGLYWPSAGGKEKSPIGPLLAYASEQGLKLDPKLHKPFHGYYYGILVTQGIWANGGLRDYSRGGVMTRGFGFIAWPADYGKSGVNSFITNGDRLVYQRDLAQNTNKQAPFTTQFSPDGWLRVEQ
jgi:hypothetical protein